MKIIDHKELYHQDIAEKGEGRRAKGEGRREGIKESKSVTDLYTKKLRKHLKASTSRILYEIRMVHARM